MTTRESPFLAFWRAANAPLVALGLPPVALGEARRLYALHAAQTCREITDTAERAAEAVTR